MEFVVKLKNGAEKRVQQGTTLAQLVGEISVSLKKTAIAGKVDDKLVDLDYVINHSCEVEIVTLESSEGLDIYRHSIAHLMAQAIKRLYGQEAVKLGIGPVIKDGFYYDIDLNASLSLDELEHIEAEMKRIVKQNLPIVRKELSRDQAVELFTRLNDPYKLELIAELPDSSVISVYEQGEFIDLCRGPHLPATGMIKVFKLQSVAGAYWRGNSNNKVLQRIYGTAFVKQSQLDDHLYKLEEAKKRDHRKLGKELELFMFSGEAPGMPFFLPNGMTIRNELEDFARRLQQERGYDEVRTPLMMNNRVWEQSGHWEHYKDNMYFTDVDQTKYALKPMNCPGHMLIFKHTLRSYRDLPIRISEFGQVHRHEYSGALSGMMRVRTFCQDDAHIFASTVQIEEEISDVLSLIDHVYKVLGFSYTVELSTRPDDFMGSVGLWDAAEQALANVLSKKKIEYSVNEGDGAFYGPKIDFHIVDALDRSWQCGTVQLDFQMPEKFDLSYIGEDGQKHRPVVIHRALYGSIERFIGILTEHFAGAFPLWLAPVQVKLLAVSSKFEAYLFSVKKRLNQAGIRCTVDMREEKLGYKIREAQLERVPYILIIGEQEQENEHVSIRQRGRGDIDALHIDAFIKFITEQRDVYELT